MSQQSTELDLFISALYQPEVRLSDSLNQANPCFLWNSETEHFRVNLTDNVGPRQSIFDKKGSKLVTRLEEVALQSMIQHLMDISRPRPSNYLVDRLLRDTLRHRGGRLENVDGFP